MRRAGLAALGAALVAGCLSDGGERQRPARSAPSTVDASAPATAASGRVHPEPAQHGAAIARIGGRELSATALLAQWFQRDPAALGEHVELVVAGELARLEAERLGVRVGAAAHQRRLHEHLDALAELWRERHPDLAFDDVLRERLRVDPDGFRARLADETLRELVTERVVRLASLGRERARVRILTTDGETRARELAAEARAGADFAALAREHSTDRSKAQDGLLPLLPHDPEAPLARHAFAAPVGVVDGPFALGDRHLLLLVEERIPPRAGTWAELAADVEASLADQPVHEAEYVAWQREAERRWPVDLAPLRELLGEPAPRRH